MSALHHKLINQRRWAIVRKRVFIRDKYTCQICGRVGGGYSGGRLECDHIRPLHQSATEHDIYSLENLQCLCFECHREKSRKENQKPISKERAAWIKRRDQNTR